MTRAKTIIRIINLLLHRSTVQFSDIAKMAEVSPRTVYRIVNDISESGIPIVYDREYKSYRILSGYNIDLNDISLHDTLLIYIALLSLKQRVNEEYGKEIAEVVRKLSVRQPQAVDDILGELVSNGISAKPKDDLSSFISRIVTKVAVVLSGKLRLITNSKDNGKQQLTMSNPSLKYKGEWFIQGTTNTKHKEIKLSKVLRAKVVQ